MHNIIETVTHNGETILQVLAAFFVALLTNWLTNRSRDRADRQGEKATLQAQVDAFINAIAVLRNAAHTNELIWEGPKETLRAVAIVGLGFVGGLARAGGADRTGGWGYASGLGEAAHLLSREVHARKLALAGLQGPMVQLGAAATPLMRHPDERLARAVDDVLAAAGDMEDPGRFEQALTVFGQAARVALQDPPSAWARLRRRTN
ncbi:hypothetical protein ACWD7C_12895 [Streptomyces sp. NPDC005134]|uniref:hypothetical protein n=1 Tax=unclassified Streptomyces TaxID=2593676 RepID=UPI0033BACCBD